jgi:hypothetical protein
MRTGCIPAKGSELSGGAKLWGVDAVVKQKLTVRDWHFDTEVFSNGYKIFKFVLPPKTSLKS